MTNPKTQAGKSRELLPYIQEVSRLLDPLMAQLASSTEKKNTVTGSLEFQLRPKTIPVKLPQTDPTL